MTDLRFSPQQRAALSEKFFDPWARDAACRTQNGIPGQLWAPMFLDDVAAKPDPDDYEWPRRVKDAMRVCADCPVRRQCLEASFEETGSYLRQFGVRGGIPGRIREALGFRTCPECRGRGYHRTITIGGRVMTFAEWEWVYQGPDDDPATKKDRAKGFGCVPCGGTGKVVAPKRVAACNRWFGAFTRKQRWNNSKTKGSAA